MKIGCPKETKNNEFRVGLTPNSVHAYVKAGHTVCIEKGAGLGSSITDDEYKAAGAKILDNAADVWKSSEMMVKVKEPLEQEYGLMQEGQIVYTYFHFAANRPLLNACLERKIIALAYETVEEGHTLPLLKPMSAIAGRMSALMGAFYLARPQGGRGVLPMGVTGVAPARIVILGGGTVGENAAQIAAGLGADVTVLDVRLPRLEFLDMALPANSRAVYNDPVTLTSYIQTADIIIGAVLIPGAKAPKLITRKDLALMKPGSVLVDVAIDQGGCFETSHPTSHDNPVYTEDSILHYCVANMPGAYARTATFALNNATISYGLELASKGVKKACLENPSLLSGLNSYKGTVTFPAVAEAFELSYTHAKEALTQAG